MILVCWGVSFIVNILAYRITPLICAWAYVCEAVPIFEFLAHVLICETLYYFW